MCACEKSQQWTAADSHAPGDAAAVREAQHDHIHCRHQCLRKEPAVDDSDGLALEDAAKQLQMNQGISFYFLLLALTPMLTMLRGAVFFSKILRGDKYSKHTGFEKNIKQSLVNKLCRAPRD